MTNTSSYVVKIEALEVEAHYSGNIARAKAGTVKGADLSGVVPGGGGLVKIQAEDAAGYIRVPGNASLVEKTSQKVG